MRYKMRAFSITSPSIQKLIFSKKKEQTRTYTIQHTIQHTTNATHNTTHTQHTHNS